MYGPRVYNDELLSTLLRYLHFFTSIVIKYLFSLSRNSIIFFFISYSLLQPISILPLVTFRRNVAVIVEMAYVPRNQIHFRILVTHTLISCCILILYYMSIPGVILLCHKRISACKQKRGN